MDEIQKVLVKAGRKDLAQKYYEKVADQKTKPLIKDGNEVYWIGVSEPRHTFLDSSLQYVLQASSERDAEDLAIEAFKSVFQRSNFQEAKGVTAAFDILDFNNPAQLEIFNRYRLTPKEMKAFENGKAVRVDYRTQVLDYRPRHWYG